MHRYCSTKYADTIDIVLNAQISHPDILYFYSTSINKCTQNTCIAYSQAVQGRGACPLFDRLSQFQIQVLDRVYCPQPWHAECMVHV